MGVDWHRRGWVAVVLRGEEPARALVADDLGMLIDRVADVACVGVDMPIGLPDTEREADVLARAFVGPRRSSVFATPPAAVLSASSFAAANVVARQRVGKGISQQAWALRHNIARVAGVAAADPRVIEVHPEVSFCALQGEPLRFAKTTWNGHALRRAALARAGIDLPDDLGEAGTVHPVDVLDAAVAAWSARRYAEGRARSLPAGAAPGERGVIWY
jgi:predicted RNase H-like nuclease